jgi:crotonobetainyl-CoA:carnitine CoA-transferase CaiB-like acyl-CoA transferase
VQGDNDGVDQALAGLRVLEVASGIAGAYAGQLMAGLGADVVKVEPPGSGDPLRREGPFPGDKPDPEASGLFLYLNAGKRSVTLDIARGETRDVFDRLVARSDLLVLDLAPARADALGLAYAELAARHPEKVVVALTPFGLDGPYRDYSADDITLQALSGLMDITGEPGDAPLQVGVPLAGYAAGTTAFTAALTARFHQLMTGEGQLVDVSMLEAMTAIMEHSPVTWVYQGVLRKRTGKWGGAAAWGLYPCADGFVGVISGLGESYQRFRRLIGPPLTEDRFASLGARSEFVDEMNAAIVAWLADKTKDEAYHLAQAQRLPFSYICDASDVLRSGQLQERGFFAEVDHPVAGHVTYPGAPFRMSETPWRDLRAPLLGEHNDDVYRLELGLDAATLVRLGLVSTAAAPGVGGLT